MINLYTHIDKIETGYYITHVEDYPVPDEEVSNYLRISLEQYQNILKSFGAKCESKYEECYFKYVEDAEKCIEFLKTEIENYKFKNKNKGFCIVCQNCGSSDCEIDFGKCIIVCKNCKQGER